MIRYFSNALFIPCTSIPQIKAHPKYWLMNFGVLRYVARNHAFEKIWNNFLCSNQNGEKIFHREDFRKNRMRGYVEKMIKVSTISENIIQVKKQLNIYNPFWNNSELVKFEASICSSFNTIQNGKIFLRQTNKLRNNYKTFWSPIANNFPSTVTA